MEAESSVCSLLVTLMLERSGVKEWGGGDCTEREGGVRRTEGRGRNADTEEEAANGTRLNGVGVGASWGLREELVSHGGVLQEMEETV